MVGSQVAKITESKNPAWPVGKRIVGYIGWRSHTILNPTKFDTGIVNQKPYIIPDFENLSPSLALGVLGMPGLVNQSLFYILKYWLTNLLILEILPTLDFWKFVNLNLEKLW